MVYEKKQNEFTWYKFDQQRQLHHTKNDVITQICENFLVSLDLNKGTISIQNLSKIESAEDIQKFEVRLENYHKGQISSFVPKMNTKKSFMILAVSYGRVKNTQWNDQKFQGMILIDIDY